MNRVRGVVRAEKLYQNGIFGKDIAAAVLDTGLYPHPDFEGRIAAFQDCVNHKNSLYDDCSHGTHVSGILGGSGAVSGRQYMGIAPECRLVAVKVLDRKGNGNKEDVLAGIDWVIKNRIKYGIRIMNVSVGTIRESSQRDRELIEGVENAWDAGIVVVVAAGNMGPEPMTITVPGNSRKVITVGADGSFRPYFSGMGPTAECVCKPDIVAPGSEIVSCNAVTAKNKNYYTTKSGTSMATPVVSGAIALLLSKYPDMTNVEVKMKLRESAVDLGFPRNRQGWGRIDIEKLLQ